MTRTLTLPPVVIGEWVPMTYEEWCDWVPPGKHGEWMYGKGIIFMPPTAAHNWDALLLANS